MKAKRRSQSPLASRQKAKRNSVRRQQRPGRGDRSRRGGEQVWQGGALLRLIKPKDLPPRND